MMPVYTNKIISKIKRLSIKYRKEHGIWPNRVYANVCGAKEIRFTCFTLEIQGATEFAKDDEIYVWYE